MKGIRLEQQIMVFDQLRLRCPQAGRLWLPEGVYAGAFWFEQAGRRYAGEVEFTVDEPAECPCARGETALELSAAVCITFFDTSIWSSTFAWEQVLSEEFDVLSFGDSQPLIFRKRCPQSGLYRYELQA